MTTTTANSIHDRSKEVWQELKYALAKSITSVDAKNNLLNHYCTLNNWNNKVCSQIEDGLKKLGVALATLEQWYEYEEEWEGGDNDNQSSTLLL